MTNTVTPAQLKASRIEVSKFFILEYYHCCTDMKMILQDLLPKIENSKPFTEIPHEYFGNRTLTPLIHYLLDRANAIVILSEQNLIWDAEIILRSMLECFSKIINLLDVNTDKLSEKLEQYWITLELFESKRRSDKAKEMRPYDLNTGDIFASMIMTDEQEKELEAHPDWRNRNFRK